MQAPVQGAVPQAARSPANGGRSQEKERRLFWPVVSEKPDVPILFLHGSVGRQGTARVAPVLTGLADGG